jgi:hypothetical protein
MALADLLAAILLATPPTTAAPTTAVAIPDMSLFLYLEPQGVAVINGDFLTEIAASAALNGFQRHQINIAIIAHNHLRVW